MSEQPSDRPIFCTLQPGELNAKAMQLLPGIAGQATRCMKIENGYRLEFNAGRPPLMDIVRMVDAERQCCRFLRFVLTAEPDEGPIALELTGPPGAREFLDGMIDLA